MCSKYSIGLLLLLLVFAQLSQSAPKPKKHDHKQNETTSGDSTRSIDWNKSKKTTPKPVYNWRPSEDTKASLAKQKGLDKIPDNDPEFEFLWADDYYDDYDFEHARNMIQHGTWEALRQNYHDAQLQEARDAAKKQKEQNEAIA